VTGRRGFQGVKSKSSHATSLEHLLLHEKSEVGKQLQNDEFLKKSWP
jgi:hypothetical protein